MMTKVEYPIFPSKNIINASEMREDILNNIAKKAVQNAYRYFMNPLQETDRGYKFFYPIVGINKKFLRSLNNRRSYKEIVEDLNNRVKEYLSGPNGEDFKNIECNVILKEVGKLKNYQILNEVEMFMVLEETKEYYLRCQGSIITVLNTHFELFANNSIIGQGRCEFNPKKLVILFDHEINMNFPDIILNIIYQLKKLEYKVEKSDSEDSLLIFL